MKKSLFVAAIFAFHCSFAQNHKSDASPKMHSIVADSVLQTANYTYLHGLDNKTPVWLAIPLLDASVGKTYYFSGGMVMNDFASKELKRTFASVIFLGGVTEEPITDNNGTHADKPYKRTATAESKQTIKIEPTEGCISLADLFAKKDAYAGKTVKIKAQITKYNNAIMDKNWAHIQDGSEANGKFDLVVTTNQSLKVGDVVILEGTIVLNKDFGYGYTFEVMMENAKQQH